MATTIFRVEKNKNFTVVSNYHLRDKNLSLKAKGLLTLILSFSDNWDYTLNSLVAYSRDGVDATRSTLAELELNGYLRRSRSRNSLGQLQVTEYTVYEHPIKADVSHMEKSDVDENIQIGKSKYGEPKYGESTYGKSNTYKYLTHINTNSNNNHLSSNEHNNIVDNPHDEMDKIDEATQLFRQINKYSSIVKGNIGYDELICLNPQDKEFLDLVIDVMLEAICSKKKTLTIGGQPFLQEVVKSQLLKLDENHIEYVQACIADSSTKIKNIRAYLLTALYNSIVGADLYWEKTVKSDFNQHENSGS